jgi:hypothetical protein
MRLVVEALMRTIPAVTSMMAFSLVLFLSFSILGVPLLKGQFYSCQGVVFESLRVEQQHILIYPKLYQDLTAPQKLWRNGTEYSGITSRAVCDWFGAQWLPTMPQTFNNVSSVVTYFKNVSPSKSKYVTFAGV